MRYLDIDKTIKEFEEQRGNESTLLNCYNADWIVSFLEAQPTADVQEVKHAKNLQNCFKWTFECSLCHWCDDDTYCADTSEFKFCPNCGAKMDNDDFCSMGERRKEDVDA